MISPTQFKQELENHKIDYNAFACSQDCKAFVSNNTYDMNLFIPVRGRLKFFKPCVDHIRLSAMKAGIKIRIVIIENDSNPTYSDVCTAGGVDYVFLPKKESRSLGLFEKSLCYNVGFLTVPKTEWCIFHDIDILVGEDYFEKVRTHLSRNPKWLQPYTKKRVRMLSPWATCLIVGGTYEKSSAWFNDNSYPSKPGSPGGSIVVRSSDFEAVGGYDPELFYGYSPEDAFFWVKLELIHRDVQGVIEGHFLGSATYADNPSIEVYHMDHQVISNQNPVYGHMIELLQSFYWFNPQDRMKIVEVKRAVFGKGA